MRSHVFARHAATEKEKAIRTIRVYLHHGCSDAWHFALYRRTRSKWGAGGISDFDFRNRLTELHRHQFTNVRRCEERDDMVWPNILIGRKIFLL